MNRKVERNGKRKRKRENEFELIEEGNYYKVGSSSLYPPFFFTDNNKFADVLSDENNIDSCFGSKTKGIFSKLFNEDPQRAPMLRDRYMAIDKKTCYPTLMTAPYEVKYYKFYWGFGNNQLEERRFWKDKNTIDYYKLHLNEIKFATDADNFRDENYLSLQGKSGTIDKYTDKYKGIYKGIKKEKGFFEKRLNNIKTLGKGIAGLGTNPGIYTLTDMELKKQKDRARRTRKHTHTVDIMHT